MADPKPSRQDDDLLSIPGNWNITYNYAAGRTASRFFRSLRDHQKIEATVCSKCERVLAPPRGFCDRCFSECKEWREVGPEGRVVTFTVSNIASAGVMEKPPFMIALIRLDGASTNLIHVVQGCDLTRPEEILERVRAGLRVRAEFKPQPMRSGHILDISAFRVTA